MRLLVIGSTGLVGSKVLEQAHEFGYEVYGTHNARSFPNLQSHKLDITNAATTTKLVEKIRPVAIVNTAALHNVDYCETHRLEASRTNVDGVRTLSEAASKFGSRLIQLSTDYVFDGESGPYGEADHPTPQSYYAQTKLDAEQVSTQASSYAIARPSVIYGWNKLESTETQSSSGKTINFAMFVLEKFAKGETVKAVTDQFGSPTFADNLADAILRLVRLPENGIFHTAGRSCVSRYDFALKIAETFGYSKKLVEPVTSAGFKQLAHRPKNSCLNVAKSEKVLGMQFLTIEEGLAAMKSQAVSADMLP